MKNKYLAIFLMCCISVSCKYDKALDLTKESYEVLAPKEYAAGNELVEFKIKDLPELIQPIKSIEFGNNLYVLDLGQGIHVYQFNGFVPEKISFFKMPAITDFEIENRILMASSARKIIYLKLEDTSTRLLETKLDVLAYPNYPFGKNIPFECADSTKYAISWEVKKAEKISCYR